jgi:hypothetical protein
MKDLGFFLRARLLPKRIGPPVEVIDLCGDTQDGGVGPLAGATVQSGGREVHAPPVSAAVVEPTSTTKSGGKADVQLEPPVAGSVEAAPSTRRKEPHMPNPRGTAGVWMKRLRGPSDLWGPSLFDSGFGYQHHGGSTAGASSYSDGSRGKVAQPVAVAATTIEGDHGKAVDEDKTDWGDPFFAGGPGTLSVSDSQFYKLNEY